MASVLVFSATGAGAASPYDIPISRAAQWLSSQQNTDGSWGASPDIQPFYTAEAVRALSTAYKRQGAYFAGLTWLESHAGGNVDFVSRRIDGLTNHGDDLVSSLAYLQSAQSLSGTTYSGWGLSSFYGSSAIDTALALLAYSDLGSTLQVQPALDYLKSTQRTGVNDKGWVVGSADISDPAVTALVVQALVRFKSLDTTLATRITDAVATLNVLVDATALPTLQALAAQAAFDAGNSSAATTFLNRLTATQTLNGDWAGDTYATALATRALATAANLATQGTLVSIPDQALRKAINLALGRNAMDNLSQGELAQLTTLSAVNQGIVDLTGLQWATNLTSADLRNNNITSATPLSGLTQLTSLLLAGNPVAGNGSVAVPMLPEWGLVLMGALLMTITSHFRRSRSVC